MSLIRDVLDRLVFIATLIVALVIVVVAIGAEEALGGGE